MKELNIEMISDAGAMRPELAEGKLVVVIDVLRATSVMLTAFSKGVKCIYPFSGVDEARGFYARLSTQKKLLCGERNAEKPEGFDGGNSPSEYLSMDLQGHEMVMTTSNGTRAIQHSKGASKQLIGSFLNLSAVVKAIFESNQKDIILLCSGTQNRFSLDDGYCAASIVRALQDKVQVNLNDLAWAVAAGLPSSQEELITSMQHCYHYKLLESKRFDADLKYCFLLDRYDIVPYIKEGRVVL